MANELTEGSMSILYQPVFTDYDDCSIGPAFTTVDLAQQWLDLHIGKGKRVQQLWNIDELPVNPDPWLPPEGESWYTVELPLLYEKAAFCRKDECQAPYEDPRGENLYTCHQNGCIYVMVGGKWSAVACYSVHLSARTPTQAGKKAREARASWLQNNPVTPDLKEIK